MPREYFSSMSAHTPRAPHTLPSDFACLCCILYAVEFRYQLSDPRAKKTSDAPCHVSALILVETEYRPARRQAAVAVTNLGSTPDGTMSVSPRIRPTVDLSQTGIVGSLVTLAMLRSKEKKEEEIGTKRECMRAPIGLAESTSTRMVMIKACRGSR